MAMMVEKIIFSESIHRGGQKVKIIIEYQSSINKTPEKSYSVIEKKAVSLCVSFPVVGQLDDNQGPPLSHFVARCSHIWGPSALDKSI